MSNVNWSSWLGLTIACAVLTHCAGDHSKKKVEASAGESGAAGEGASTSGGSSTGPGGAPNAAGVAGEADSSGNGGAAGAQAGGAAGQSSGAGAGGEAGAGVCSVAPNPASCCEVTDVACDEDWTMACYADRNVTHYCCDAVNGIRRGCEYDGDFYTYSDQVCVDPCTGKGFGTASCADCLGNRAACDAGHCGADQTACDNVVGGFSLSCTRGTRVTCVCDPELD